MLDLSQDTETDLPSLTFREAEVLEYLWDGYHQNQIAQILGVTYRTVKAHLASARDKYGAQNNEQLVRLVTMQMPQPEDTDRGRTHDGQEMTRHSNMIAQDNENR